MMLELTGVDAGYGNVKVLFDVSLTVDEGEVVVLLGANGAGKSTVLKTICGDVTASSGTVTFEGEDITELPPNEVVGRGIAHVPEGRELFPASTVAENLRLGAYTADGTTDGTLEWVYELFPRLEERRAQKAGTLSGGEQQMLAIGRGLMADPDLLLLDEVTLGLAPVIVEDVFEAVAQISSEGKTVLLVEQDLYNALGVADRGYLMESGQIVLDGPVDEISEMDRLQQAYLGG